MFIFDQTVAYSGGMNVGDDYSGGYDAEAGWSGRHHSGYWKDYMVRMEGPASAITRNTFFGEGIKEEALQQVPQERGLYVRVLHNEGGKVPETVGRDTREYASRKQISFATYYLIDNAQKEILMEHAYIMDPTIVMKLKQAAERGVKISIVRGKPQSSKQLLRISGKEVDRAC